jgi:hypothetical protein
MYSYWVVRFVPDVARGEFSNVGLVAGADGLDWAVSFDSRFIKNHGHYSSDLRELRAWIEWFQRSVSTESESELARPNVSSGWIEHLRARQANSIQFSPASVIEAESARAAVDLLFPHLVERDEVRRRSSLTRSRMRTAVRDTLVHELGYSVGENLLPRPRVSIGRQRGAFDFAVWGDARWSEPGQHLQNVWAFNVISLDALETEIQSWNYLVGRLRADGGHLEAQGASVAVDSATPIEAIIDAPNPSRPDSDHRAELFEAATEAWELNGVRVTTLDDFMAGVRAANVNTVA